MNLSSVISSIDWSIWISIIALLGTIFTYFKHDQKLKRQERLINEYQLEKIKAEKVEQRKANVKARLIKEGNKTKIKFYNEGIAIARSINLSLVNNEDITFFSNNLFPYKYLNSKDSFEVPIFLHSASPDTLELQLTWDDDFKQGNEHNQILQL